jgi:HlyD family secretion protein
MVSALSLALVAALVVFFVRRALGPWVEVVAPARADLVQTIVASGRVASPGEINVGSMLSGVIHALHVREGDRVTAGQLLVEFDDEDLAAQVAQARAGVLVAASRVSQLRAVGARVAVENVRQAETQFRSTLATLARQRALATAGVVTVAELETSQRALDVARSQLDSAQVTAAGTASGGGDARVAVAGRVQAEAALRVAETRLAQARIVAPATGVIARRNVEAGDVVLAGRTLLVLLRDGVTELSVTPDERILADVRLGQRALASADAFASPPFDGVVSYVAPAVDALRGVVEVRVRVDDPPAFLLPAMTVSVEIELGRRAAALSLDAALVRDAATADPWVLVLEGGRAARRAVRLGVRGERRVEVVSGLRESDRVLAVSAPVVAGGRARVRATPVR